MAEALGLGDWPFRSIPRGKVSSRTQSSILQLLNVRIHVVEDKSGEESYNTGGLVPGVGVADGNGTHRLLSGTSRGMINEDNWYDVAVDPFHSGNNTDAEYVSVVGGGTDAI
jgi:hypothetical protein